MPSDPNPADRLSAAKAFICDRYFYLNEETQMVCVQPAADYADHRTSVLAERVEELDLALTDAITSRDKTMLDMRYTIEVISAENEALKGEVGELKMELSEERAENRRLSDAISSIGGWGQIAQLQLGGKDGD